MRNLSTFSASMAIAMLQVVLYYISPAPAALLNFSFKTVKTGAQGSFLLDTSAPILVPDPSGTSARFTGAIQNFTYNSKFGNYTAQYPLDLYADNYAAIYNPSLDLGTSFSFSYLNNQNNGALVEFTTSLLTPLLLPSNPDFYQTLKSAGTVDLLANGIADGYNRDFFNSFTQVNLVSGSSNLTVSGNNTSSNSVGTTPQDQAPKDTTVKSDSNPANASNPGQTNTASNNKPEVKPSPSSPPVANASTSQPAASDNKPEVKPSPSSPPVANAGTSQPAASDNKPELKPSPAVSPTTNSSPSASQDRDSNPNLNAPNAVKKSIPEASSNLGIIIGTLVIAWASRKKKKFAIPER